MNDFCKFVSTNLDRIRVQASESSEDCSVEMDAYVESRILGTSTEFYLDRFEAYVAIDLCAHLGEFLKSHRVGSPFVADELRHGPARNIGFHVARMGEEAIQSVVASVIFRKRPKGTAKFLFGSLGRWLRANANREEFSELIELLQDVAERNLPFGPGEMCFVPVRQRHLHSVHSAGLEYGLFEKRIVELLHEAGLIEKASKKRGSIFFDAGKAHQVLLAPDPHQPGSASGAWRFSKRDRAVARNRTSASCGNADGHPRLFANPGSRFAGISAARFPERVHRRTGR